MPVYGKLILNEQNIESFIMDTFCDGDIDRMHLCLKYIAKKLKPLQQTVSKAISNLKINKYCKPVNFTDVSDILYIGLELAKFEYCNVVDDNGKTFDTSTDEGHEKFHRYLHKKSKELIEEIKKLNKIEGIFFDYYAEEREHSVYNPATFLKMEKKFFDDFMKENPIKPMKSDMEAKEIADLISKKARTIAENIYANQDKLLFTNDILKQIKEDIQSYNKGIEDTKKYTALSYIKRFWYEYRDTPENEIPQKLIDGTESMLKRTIDDNEQKIKELQVLSKKELSNKFGIKCTLGTNEMLIQVTSLTRLESDFFAYRIIQLIKEELKKDEDLKSLEVRFDKDPRNQKIKSIIRNKFGTYILTSY